MSGLRSLEYDEGYDAYMDGEPFDKAKSCEWREGWRDAYDDMNVHEDFF